MENSNIEEIGNKPIRAIADITANVFGLGEVCEALACAVWQIAPNPCYMKCRLINDKAKLEH